MTVRRRSLFVGLCLAGTANAADPPALVKTTHTYKTVGDVKIQADIHRPDDAKMRPVVVWIHGGDKKVLADAHDKALAFIRAHLKAKE